jgi:hypothetical protein
MSTTWLLSQLHWQRPGFWLLVSFGLSALLLVINWRLPAERRQGRRLARWFFVPYLGMVAGGISPRLMGLTDIDWVAGLGMGVALIFTIWVLLILMRATLHVEEESVSVTASTLFSSAILWQVVTAGAQEFHWTFLRAAVREIIDSYPVVLQSADYWMLWVASLIALPGIIVQYRRNSQRLIAGVVLLTTAVLYLYTRNFWLCWLLHATVQLLLGQHALHRQPAPES